MNIAQLHTASNVKGVSAKSIFTTENSSVLSIQIKKGEQLKEHITNTPAMLLCVEGQAIFEYTNGQKTNLQPGDFILIEPNVKHFVDGIEDAQLVLVR